MNHENIKELYMDFLTLKYEEGYYHCYPSQSSNELLDLAISLILTEEIRDSDYYKEFIYELPYNKYAGNAYYLDRVDNNIILGFLYGYDRAYLPLDKFENLMIQWRQAYNTKPNEMIISVDENKNFKISYSTQENKSSNTHNPIHQKINDENNIELIFSPSNTQAEDNYFEIEPIEDRLFAFPPDANPTLSLFADLLISDFPLSDYEEKLAQPPYEYYDDRYYLAIVEDRILIYDKTEEVKAFPPYDKFLDLMRKWQIASKEKSELYRIYIENDYDFKVFILEEIK